MLSHVDILKKNLLWKMVKEMLCGFFVFISPYDKHKCTVIAFKPSFSTLQVLQIWTGSKKFPQEEWEKWLFNSFPFSSCIESLGNSCRSGETTKRQPK